ncbi:heat shock 70 kDa protein 12A-like isoform X2 [Egretta garzetta]|uniref:heat shock 70 kDa protein 12A-like isoform X2 n=1 Tax=Egretta garzetta TaxID=188379 RepID=UPI00163B7BF5|nr:heat shock 70 kDa protein 12A-like isoform X2 [Egretta garzetta]XP_035759162.1 heat shock 70 kDa protein 12A-like isoform X2 [Egretta garzetta]XP_035759163.1 heat shock 70 kDa protein 12A-like isoform X2 [Egretta garzetta]XP_035759164.1 heat shock 70 kDa protein 12A-like isoform X2 [Egretta garzetta]
MEQDETTLLLSPGTDQIRQVYWGMEHGFKTPKTPTCILFNQKREFRKFGYDAVMKYKNLPSSEADNWYFFQNFKMKLYNTKVTSGMELKASNGKMLPALTVFSESLRYLKDHAMNTIQEASFQTICDQEEVTWVITVPAIWSAAARQFMRLAAKQAGLISDMISEKLIIALEPEAASLWCKQLPQKGFMVDSSDKKKFEDSPGIQYIVVDCGGGTIDITVHEIQENHCLKELHKASGGGWGGNRVDENFTDFLKEIFDDGVWDEYVKNHPTELQQMMYNFSLQKCSASKEAVCIRCYYNLTKVATCKKDMSHFFEKAKGAVWCDGMIMITYEKMKSFFDYSIKNIICTLREILKKPEMAKVQYILLVGGFAPSIILRDAISQAFSQKYHILCPMDAQGAIAKGAVLFGVNPCIVASRVSARTYGIAVTQEFDAAIHDHRKRRVSKADGYVYCTDLFKKLVGIEESVNINEIAHYEFHPIEPDQTSVTFSFYCTEKQDAQYIDEGGLECIGSCVVPTPDTMLGRKRTLKLEIKFGVTEFKATCTDVTSKQSRAVVIDFLAV